MVMKQHRELHYDLELHVAVMHDFLDMMVKSLVWPVTCNRYLMDKNFYGLIPPPLRATHSTSSPASSASPPSQWHQPITIKRVMVFLPTFSVIIQFTPVMCDRYLMDKNYYGYPPPLRGVSYLGKEAGL